MSTLLRWVRKRIFGAKKRVDPRPSPAAPKPAPVPKILQLPHPDGIAPLRTSIDFTGVERFTIGKAILAKGLASYEPEVFSIIGALIETSAPPVRVLDIGANVGVFSLSMAALFGDTVRVTAFEPMPELAAFLKTAAARNKVTVEVKQMALGTRDEQAKFYLSSQSDASNSLNESFRAHRGVIDVEVRKLDSLSEMDHAGAYVLKLDTESTEPDVLAGARAFIAKHRPPIICEVLANRTEQQIEKFFREVEYIPIHITDDPAWDGATTVVGDSTYKHRDWLFLPAPASEPLRAAFARWIAAYRA